MNTREKLKASSLRHQSRTGKALMFRGARMVCGARPTFEAFPESESLWTQSEWTVYIPVEFINGMPQRDEVVEIDGQSNRILSAVKSEFDYICALKTYAKS